MLVLAQVLAKLWAQLLNTRQHAQLRIVGLDFNYCVLKTALAARARGYAVTVVTDGTLAAGKTDKSTARLQAAGVALA